LGLGSGDITKRLPQRRREARCKEPRINRASNRWFDSDRCDNGNSKDVFDIASTKGATVFFDEGSDAGYYHICLHTFGPWPLFYRAATALFTSGLGAHMRESEERTAAFPTQTFAGRLLQNQFDVPPFALLCTATSSARVKLKAFSMRPVATAWRLC
jgi:hypothetical protein